MKTYQARVFGNVFVWKGGNRRVLDPRLDLARHSPDGLSWGYSGSGCAQLSLAILADVYDDEKALRLYQRFKERAIAMRHRDAPFDMTLDQVMATVEEIEKECAA